MKNLLSLFLLLCTISVQAQLNVTASKSTALYEAGESMNFQVTSNQWGEATYEIRNDSRTPAIRTGTILLSPGQVASIPYTSNKPGFVICVVTQFGQVSQAGAGFSPYQIQPAEDEPADFDEFWNNKKAELAAVPMSPNLNYHSETTYSTTYTISLGNVEGRRVYGYISIPKGGGRYPAILTVPSAGNVPNIASPETFIADQGAAIAMSISIHNAPADQRDPQGYQPDEVTNRERIYFKYAILAGIRSIDYIYSRPEFDGNNLGVVGVSQGGGLSFMLAGIDQRVKLMVQSNAAMANHAAYEYGEATGYPFYLWRTDLPGATIDRNAIRNATKYYDAVYFARRFKGPSMHTMSYEDDVCPPATTFAAYNQLTGNKVLLHSRDLGHSHPFEYWGGRFDFWRKVFPSMRNQPGGFNNSKTGYHADAGPETLDLSGNTTALNGIATRDDAPLNNVDVNWGMVSGPGQVSFSNPKALTTNATFSAPGTYRLSLIVNDYAQLANEAKFFTMTDYITVNVGGTGGGDVVPPTVALSTSATDVDGPFNVSVNFSETIKDFELTDINVVNGSISALNGNAQNYTFQVTPSVDGAVSVSIPADVLSDLADNKNTASNVLTVQYKKNDGGGGGGGTGKIDLELDLTSNLAAYKVFENISYQLTITNKGTIAATGIKVDFPLVQGQAFVEVSSSAGSYAGWTGVWDIPELAAGATATMDLQLYATADVGTVNAFAQVTAADQEDIDSSPANNNTSEPREDDEVVLVLSPDDGNGGGGGGGDTTPPTVAISTTSSNVTAAFTININFSETVDGLGIDDFDITNAIGSSLSGADQNYSLRINPVSSGNVTIQLRANAAADAAGNGNTVSNALTINYSQPVEDTKSPSVNLSTGSAAVTGDFLVNVNVDEEVVGLGMNDFTVENGTVVSLTGNTLYYALTVRPLNEGVVRVRLEANVAADAAGNGNNASNTVSVNYTPPGGGGGGGTGEICDAKGEQPWNQWINRVQFGGIDKWSGKDQYGDYTDQVAYLTTGQDQFIELLPGYSWLQYSEYWRVWIDLNKDGDFFDAGELVFEANGIGAMSGFINLPVGTAEGETRMRIAMKNDNYAGPCETFVFGEVEDYKVSITAGNGGGGGGGGGGSNGSYCPVNGNASQDWIKRVVLNTIDNSSDKEGYADYSYLSTDVNIGQALNFQLESGKTNPNRLEYWRIWIDYDQDGSFEQLSNLIYSYTTNGIAYGVTFIPGNAKPGPTRIRISMRRDGYLENACDEVGRGEVEEYTINIGGSANLRTGGQAELPTFDQWAIYPNPVQDFLHVDLTEFESLDLIDQPVTLRILNPLGQLIQEEQIAVVPSQAIRVPTKGLKGGMYYIQLQVPNHKVASKPFVIGLK